MIYDISPLHGINPDELIKLADGRADLERRTTLAAAGELQPLIACPEDQQVNRLIMGMLAGGDLRDEARVVDELMDSGYLMQAPRL